MSKLASLNYLVDIKSALKVIELCEELLALLSWDPLIYEAGDPRDWLFDQIGEEHDVGSSVKHLQDLDLSVDLLALHWLEDFDDTLLVV